MTFKPAPFLEGRRAALAASLLFLLNLLLLIVFFAKPVAGSTFFLFVLGLLLWLPLLYVAWRAWACFTLAYWIDRNEITVVYGPVRQTIPLGDIQEIRRGEAVADWQEGSPVVQGPNGEADWAVERLVQRWPAGALAVLRPRAWHATGVEGTARQQPGVAAAGRPDLAGDG
ncbi:MAG: hypothetical protein KDI07_20345 [Anaerolineae bacterium]|nr:hypothetical protein [Anaerolineae bacterium]